MIYTCPYFKETVYLKDPAVLKGEMNNFDITYDNKSLRTYVNGALFKETVCAFPPNRARRWASFPEKSGRQDRLSRSTAQITGNATALFGSFTKTVSFKSPGTVTETFSLPLSTLKTVPLGDHNTQINSHSSYCKRSGCRNPRRQTANSNYLPVPAMPLQSPAFFLR